MRTLKTPWRIDLRTVIVGALIAAVWAIFWLNPHAPSLQGKAGADPDEALSTPLGFESYFAEPRADDKVQRIAWTAAQWTVNNGQAIVFGVLLAAGLLTLLPLLPARF